MNNSNTIISLSISDDKLNYIKAFLKALKVKFEITKQPYSDEFITKVKKSEKEFENGEFTRVQKNDLQNLLGLE
jgi:hypothetical protein